MLWEGCCKDVPALDPPLFKLPGVTCTTRLRVWFRRSGSRSSRQNIKGRELLKIWPLVSSLPAAMMHCRIGSSTKISFATSLASRRPRLRRLNVLPQAQPRWGSSCSHTFQPQRSMQSLCCPTYYSGGGAKFATPPFRSGGRATCKKPRNLPRKKKRVP